jgi:GNAT superfamily N-acetyltransferase
MRWGVPSPLNVPVRQDHDRSATLVRMAIQLSLLNEADVDETMAVVKESFDSCVAPDYTEAGRELFARVVTGEYLRSLPNRQGFTLVAKLGGRTVGMCALRDGHHITLFFVRPELHGQGIGRKLFDAAAERVRRKVPGVTKLQVHSSPVAVPVYEALGFEVTGPEEVEGGMRYVPMERSLVT